MDVQHSIFPKGASRRDLLRFALVTGSGVGASALLSACGSGSGGGGGSGTITMKLGSDSPTTSPHTAAMLKMKKLIEDGTDGRVKCNVFANGTLGANDVMLNSIKAGTLDAMICDFPPASASVPECGVFNLPFLFSDAQHALRAAQGKLGEAIGPKIEKAYKCEVVGYGSDGNVNVLNSKRAIVDPDDLKGLKIRTQQSVVQADAFAAFGALPTPLSYTEVYAALQSGVVDGAAISPSDMVAEKFYEVSKYYTLNQMFNNTQWIGVSSSFMSKLTAADQDVVRAAGKAGGQANADATFKAESDNIALLKEKGLKVAEGQNREEFLVIAKTVWAKDAETAGGQELIDLAANTV
jgi:tripartite ATP-independent transporter DctP family solute receptor